MRLGHGDAFIPAELQRRLDRSLAPIDDWQADTETSP
jgi:hypothetical protein